MWPFSSLKLCGYSKMASLRGYLDNFKGLKCCIYFYSKQSSEAERRNGKKRIKITTGFTPVES